MKGEHNDIHDLIMSGDPIFLGSPAPSSWPPIARRIAQWLREPGREPSERALHYTAALLDAMASCMEAGNEG